MKYRDEKELVRKCVSGAQGAWDEFVDRYGPYLYSVVHKTLRSNRWPFQPEDAEDILGRVFVSLFENDHQLFRSFEWRCSLKTWLWIVARKAVIRHFRRKRHPTLSLAQLAPEEDGTGQDLLPEDEHPDPLEAADRDERTALLREHLAELPERERMALVYFFFEGASYEEIAKLLDIKPHYVGTILFRAKKLLQGRLAGKLREG